MKRIILIVVMMMLWCSIGFTEPHWEQVGERIQLDVNSIHTVTIGYDDLIKGNFKTTTSDGAYILSTMLVNKDTKLNCFMTMEFYDSNNQMTLKINNDPRDITNWASGREAYANTILKRAN